MHKKSSKMQFGFLKKDWMLTSFIIEFGLKVALPFGTPRSDHRKDAPHFTYLLVFELHKTADKITVKG